MTPEKKFETKVRKFLEGKGAYVVKYFGCGFSQAGVPDLLCCYKGRFIALEIKAEKGRASDLQLYKVRKINDVGGMALVLFSKDFDKFVALIENL